MPDGSPDQPISEPWSVFFGESFGCDRIKHLLCPARATHAEIAGNKRASLSSSSTSRESALTLPLEV
ncbi:MAG: hypothetical protein ACKO81_14480, partial [Planctomycetota bacterium]